MLNFRKKKPAPTAAAAPAAAGNNAALDSLIQSALQAGLPAAAIQQLLQQAAAQPGLLAGRLEGVPTTPVTQPTLMHPQTTISVSINNLLNNSRMNGYSGVITSPLFGHPTSYQPGRDIRFSLNSRF